MYLSWSWVGDSHRRRNIAANFAALGSWFERFYVFMLGSCLLGFSHVDKPRSNWEAGS